MPDWMTHIVVGLVLAEAFNIPKKSIVLLGAILPDILPKLVLLRLFIPLPNGNYNLLSAFHVPFVFFLASIFIALLFRHNKFRIVLWLNIGAMSHFLADATLQHFEGGVRLLYPLSLESYTLNVVWPEQSYLVLIPALLVYGGLLLFKKRYKKAMSVHHG